MALKPATQDLLKRAARDRVGMPKSGGYGSGGPHTAQGRRDIRAKRIKLIRKLGGGRGAGSITPETTKRALKSGMPRKLT